LNIYIYKTMKFVSQITGGISKLVERKRQYNTSFCQKKRDKNYS